MENPFDSLEKRLAGIEEKLDSLIAKMENGSVQASNTWISTKQLSEYLGISKAAVTNLRGSKIPFYKVGGRILFKKQEVDELLEKTRHKTGGEYLDEYLYGQKLKGR
ncbi:MAG: helix-turn-helix domain-containing protein [Bacteroidia bacterium]|nr:helix-turn-helix domain-containing protein [Bacteroidia bacterium]